MAEVHVLITPAGGSELRCGDQLANLAFNTAHFFRLIESIDVVKDGARRDASNILHPVGVAISLGSREVELTGRLKAKHSRENRSHLSAILVNGGEIRHAHLGDVVSGSIKVSLKGPEEHGLGIWDDSSEVVGEPIEGLLAIDTVHANEVGGVSSIT